MNQARIYFHDSLIGLLKYDQGERGLLCSFNGNPAIKHLIEAHKIPHTEVGRIVVNGNSVSLGYQVADDDFIDIYPNACNHDIGEQVIRPAFILDCHLGKLAGYLRMLGFDAKYRNDYTDDELAEIVSNEDRILLSRDRGLLMRKVVIKGYYIRHLDPRQQLYEVMERYCLRALISPFKRCLRCNGPLHPIAKDRIAHRLQPLTRMYFDEFHICSVCNQIYWKGSHFTHMLEVIDKIYQDI